MNAKNNAARAAVQAQPIQKAIAMPATGAGLRLGLVHAEILAPITDSQATERPLKVCIRPHHLECWEYEGTRAQLEAENVIPPGTEWPEGAQNLRFDIGRFRYLLRRSRPDGVKGPKKVWTSGDWWCLRCDLIGGPDHDARRILDKRRELADELYRQSPAGQREMEAQWRRVIQACNDKAFQAFKSIVVPVRKKPGRPSKSKTTLQGPQQ